MFLSEQILWLPFAEGRFLLYSDPFHAPAKALGIQQSQLHLRPDPLKSAVGQPPVQKNIAVSCPAQCLDPICPAAAFIPPHDTRDDGNLMNPDSITDWLNNFSEKHHLPHIHPHAFQHTAASTMIANGVDIVTTANELGHANATTTANIYAHQIAMAKAKAAEVRGGVFSNRDQKTRRRRRVG